MKLSIVTSAFLALLTVEGFSLQSDNSNRQQGTWLQGVEDTMKDATSNVVGAGEKAGEKIQEGYDAAKETCKDAYQSGKDMAKEGYESGKDAVKDGYDAVKNVASDTKDTVKDTAKAAKDGVKEGVDEATN